MFYLLCLLCVFIHNLIINSESCILTSAFRLLLSKITTYSCYFIIFQLLILSGDIHPNPGPVNGTNNYSFCHINARSLTTTNRLTEIEDFISTIHDFDIVGISESHLDQSIDDSMISIPNYKILRKDRNRRGGGVCLYIKEHIPYVRKYDLECIGTESIWIEFKVNTKKFLFGCYYRPPGQNANDIDLFLHNLNYSFDLAYNQGYTSITVVGDFNDRCTTWLQDHNNSELGNKLRDFLSENNLHQLIDEPTRDLNILDLIITDSPNFITNSGVLPTISNLDHDIIFGELKIRYNGTKNFFRKVIYYDRGNYVLLNELLSRISWDPITQESSLEDDVSFLTECLTNATENCVPSKFVRIRPRDKPGFNVQVRRLYSECRRLHKIKQRSRDPLDIANYKAKRREAKITFAMSKENYYAKLSGRLTDPNTNSKDYWKLVKSVYGNRHHSGIPPLIENGSTITSDKEKADLLNGHFTDQTRPPINNL